jgi:hypothetical protein
MSWGLIKIDGTEYDLTHLDDAVIDVGTKTDPTVTFRVLISYGCHCFTREVQLLDPVSHRIADGAKWRSFCPIRTRLSKTLPGLIRDAADGGLAYFSDGVHMLLVDDVTTDKGPYAVFFKTVKAHQKNLDVVLFVVSAYLKPELAERLPAVPFVSLIERSSKGFTPQRPAKKTKSWKKKITPDQ